MLGKKKKREIAVKKKLLLRRERIRAEAKEKKRIQDLKDSLEPRVSPIRKQENQDEA